MLAKFCQASHAKPLRSTALEFDKAEFLNRPLKVGRPGKMSGMTGSATSKVVLNDVLRFTGVLITFTALYRSSDYH